MGPRLVRRLTVMAVAVFLGACNDDVEEPVDVPAEEPAEEAPVEEPQPEPEPEPEPTTYEVQSGDTLTQIAQQFGTTVQALVEANDLDDPDLIHPGDVLVIP